MNRHTRPFKCMVAGCESKHFGTSGDLIRHKREVHSAPTFNCPVVTCTRHRKGFGRKDNFNLHMKRVHQVQESPSNSPLNSTNPTQDLQSGEELPMSTSYSRSVLDISDSSNSILSNSVAIAEKIQELEGLKEEAIAKFDGDILALRRVLSIMK